MQEILKDGWKRSFGEKFETFADEYALTVEWFLPTLEEKILPALGARLQDEDLLASPLLLPFFIQISLHVQDAVWSKAAIQLDVATEPSLSPC